MRISNMAQNLIGSEIIRLAGEVKSRIQQGEKIFNLTIGDFDPHIFPIPDTLTEEITQAYAQHETNYPAANGMPELREAISRFTLKGEGLDYKADDILVASGARPLIFAAYLTLLDPGDKVWYPVPSWNNNHYSHISGSEGIVVPTAAEQNFMPTADLLAPYIEEINLVALCSPLNPTGTVFSEPQLRGICELVMRENKRRGKDQKPVYVLYDQIYWNLVYGDNVHVNPVSLMPEMRDYTIFIDGMSKAFCGTGVRVGWGFGPSDVIAKMRAVLSHAGTWSPKAEQLATARYLNKAGESDAFLAELRERLGSRLEGFYQGFSGLKAKGFKVDAIAPQAALYLTVQFDLIGQQTAEGNVLETDAEVHRYILDEAKVALVPFNAFGAENSNWYRLSIGTVERADIPVIIEQLDGALSKLSPVGEGLMAK